MQVLSIFGRDSDASADKGSIDVFVEEKEVTSDQKNQTRSYGYHARVEKDGLSQKYIGTDDPSEVVKILEGGKRCRFELGSASFKKDKPSECVLGGEQIKENIMGLANLLNVAGYSTITVGGDIDRIKLPDTYCFPE